MGQTIFDWLVSLDPEKRAGIVGGRDWGIMHLDQMELKDACGLVALCPANLAFTLFNDDRGCDSKAECRSCTRRFLMLEMPEEYK